MQTHSPWPCAKKASPNRLLHGALAALVLSLLAACGGGGTPSNQAPETSSGGQPTAPSQTVTLSGQATFDYVPSQSSALVYSKTQQKPIRGAVLEVVKQDGTVLQRTTTDEQGRYSVPLPGERTVHLRVLAQIDANGTPVTVSDNTQGNALYAVASPAFSSNAGTANVHAASGWTGSGYGEPRSAAPFAILDTVYRAQRKVLSVDPNARFKPLSLYWSTANKPAFGDPAAGEISTSHFQGGAGIGEIYLLGAADVDTDEYDESVVAHEWSHYYQWTFSRDDSPGGAHIEEELEMTIAFSEGWGHGFAGIANERADFTDAQGPAQSSGFSFPLEGAMPRKPGWFNEISVAQIIYQLGQQAGFAAVHGAMQAMAELPAFTSIYSFSYAVRRDSANTGANTGANAGDIIDRLLTAHAIVTSKQSGDPFGSGETNDGGLAISGVPPSALVLPIYQPLAIPTLSTPSTPTRVCSINVFGIANKLGNRRFLRLDAPSAGKYRVMVRGLLRPGGTTAKPVLSVLQQGVRKWYGWSASVFYLDLELPAGTTVMSVEDSDVTDGTSGAGCIDVSADNAPAI